MIELRGQMFICEGENYIYVSIRGYTYIQYTSLFPVREKDLT